MHVKRILHQVISSVQHRIHKTRCDALVAVSAALTVGEQLWLTGLGRALKESGAGKHAIKRVDRLLGNHHLHAERRIIYQCIAKACIGGKRRPVILVDWSTLTTDNQYHLLRASVAVGGRSLTLYDEVHPTERLGNQRVEQNFLKQLKIVLPKTCTPIIVTDAGFRGPWFKSVLELGWDFVGRIRNRTQCKLNGDEQWISCKSLYSRAKHRAHSMGKALLAQSNPVSCRLVLILRRQQGRVAKTKLGSKKRQSGSLKHAAREREPWLLATSLMRASETKIVCIYRSRMQIEEGFRDLKAPARGWCMDLSQTRDVERLQVLLLVGTLATLAVWLVGIWGEQTDRHPNYQANTTRSRRILSVFTLGLILLRNEPSRFRFADLCAVFALIQASVGTLEAA